MSDVRPYPILRYFEYLHLPVHLQSVSKPFSDLAILMAGQLPEGPETSAMLRKLLEAKDCAVRAALG
jgi:ferritin-like protein